MAKVTFTAEGHVYMKGTKPYTSVTTVLREFVPQFDREHWLAYKVLQSMIPFFVDLKDDWLNIHRRAINDPGFVEKCMPYIEGREKEFLAKKDALAAEWSSENKKSIHKGNRYHEDREKTSYIKGYELSPFDGKKYNTYQKVLKKGYNESICERLSDLEPGYYPELLVWLDSDVDSEYDYQIAGQVDKVFIEKIGKTKFVDVDDYKTNKKMTKTSFWYKNYGYVMMKPPLEHLQASKLQEYELQISMYARILEAHGLKPRHLALHHLNSRYDLDYRKKEIEDIWLYRDKVLN